MVTASKKGGGLVIDGVTVTNPDKVMFGESGITKEQMVRYYAQVAERMLPYVGGRVLSIVRCPRGVGSACFFKKHPGPGSSGIVTIDVSESDGETEEYFYLESAAGLVSEAQMDTMEFHVWGSRVDELEHPDTMVFDLDPDKGLDLEQVRRGVRDLKDLLDELSLTSFLKTSGGKGYHVVVPFEPASSWDAFRQFARRMAQVMAEKWPDRYTSNVRLAKRNGKIFIDWMRNGRGATSVAPYSLRARPGAPVSAPLAWDELDTVAPTPSPWKPPSHAPPPPTPGRATSRWTRGWGDAGGVSNAQAATEAADGVVRLGAVVVDERATEPPVAEEGAAALSHVLGRGKPA